MEASPCDVMTTGPLEVHISCKDVVQEDVVRRDEKYGEHFAAKVFKIHLYIQLKRYIN